MHDNIHVVQHQPPRVRRALTVMGQNACLLEFVLDFLINGLNLFVALAAADNEVIGEAADRPCIQQHNVNRLLITGGLGYPVR